MIHWKKWPDEKPSKEGEYLFYTKNNNWGKAIYSFNIGWLGLHGKEPDFWAEVNLPYYDPEPFIPFVSGNGG